MHAAGPYRPTPIPGTRMRGIGRLLFWIGGVLTVICIAGGIILAVSGFTRLAETASISHPVDGPTQIDLEAGDQMLYYVPGVIDPTTQGSTNGSGYGSDDDSDSPDYVAAGSAGCSATGPAVVEIRPGGTKHTSSSSGGTRVSDGGFTAEEAGTYTVTCSPDAGIDVVVAPPTNVGGILSGVGGVLVGVFGALGFGAVTLLGLILWLVGRDGMKKHGAL
ncbi:hypothetical protein [Brevibacterium yomogidense]|nr:hypothetical protein [Brevibacterium yomogidense]